MKTSLIVLYYNLQRIRVHSNWKQPGAARLHGTGLGLALLCSFQNTRNGIQKSANKTNQQSILSPNLVVNYSLLMEIELWEFTEYAKIKAAKLALIA